MQRLNVDLRHPGTTRRRAEAIIQDFADRPLFRDASAAEMYIIGNPYRRPTRVFDNSEIDYTTPLNKDNLASNESLSTHRLLLNIYEIDCHLLPKQLSPEVRAVTATDAEVVCTENLIRVDDVMESPKLAE